MGIVVIRPVLLVPGGIAREEDQATVRSAIADLQGWWERQGVRWIHVAEPYAPACAEPPAWFAEYPGGPFYAAQEWAFARYLQRDRNAGDTSGRVLCIMDGYPDGHGEAGLTVAVVGYGVLAGLLAGERERNRALWLMQHEIGHLLALGHVEDGAALMGAMGGSVDRYPDCDLPVLPVIG